MLNNLKAEYVRKGIDPYKGVSIAIKRSERTAKNKINEISPFTVPEAIAIIEKDFPNLTIEYLFSTDKTA